MKSEDCAVPIYVDQCNYPLSDVALVRLLSASQKALKEKASWSNLSRDEKVQKFNSTTSSLFVLNIYLFILCI